MSQFGSALSVLSDTAEILRAPRRLTVPQAAEKYVKLKTPGGYSGDWSNDLPCYMVEPAEVLTDRQFEACIFCGPAQSAKTQMLVDNWGAHTITCDPSDMMIVQTSKSEARDFSMRRVDRMHDNCPDIKRLVRQSTHADNVHDKHYRSGMILTIGWPTKNNLSGKAIGKMALTDYDRMPETIGGENTPFAMAHMRTTTFMSKGMTMAESSPSREILDPSWTPKGHEAPPTTGILALYNMGDRRRMYWQCQHCGLYFMQPPGIEGFVWNTDEADPFKAAKSVGVACPGCSSINFDRKALRNSHRWVKEGQTVDENGDLHGEGRYSNIASFWLPGAAAAFQSWRQILLKYLQAEDDCERTGDEEALKDVHNLDLAVPYLPKARRTQRSTEDLENRAEHDMRKREVPPGVLYLVAQIDVQKDRFPVQVHGYGVGRECWVIDRFDLRVSERRDDEDQPLPMEPAAYAEDWDSHLKVVNKRYPLSDGSGRTMGIMLTTCDSGGLEGVHTRAYDNWRKMKRKGLAKRYRLVKGDGRPSIPRCAESYPDTKGRTQKSRTKGDVPIWVLNTNMLKDEVAADLARDSHGPGYIHFPGWLGSWFYEELTAESRGPKGWERLNRGQPNEAFDLLYYSRAATIILKTENIDWERPPRWAAEWDRNIMVSQLDEAQPKAEKKTQGYRPTTRRSNIYSKY